MKEHKPESKANATATPSAKTEPAISSEKPVGSDSKAEATSAPGPTETGAASIRAQTEERLKALLQTPDKADSAAGKSLRETLEARLRLLEEWDKATKARESSEHPTQDTEKDASQLKTDLERLRAMLEESAKDPAMLLPESFRGRTDTVSADTMSEMKQTIETAKNDLSEATSKLEDFRSDPVRKSGSTLAALRSERDKIHQNWATLTARRAEREAAVASASSVEARELATERLINFEWEARVETERLRGKEAEIELQTQRSALDEPKQQQLEARQEIAKRTLDGMQARYRVLVDRQQLDLKRAEAKEQMQAEIANDPLEQYRAGRSAELLALKSHLLNDEHELSVDPALSLETQTQVAFRAEEDFASLKQLVDEGRASTLMALRLKNDYRRLPIERGGVARTELDRAAKEMTRWENALTAVELDLVGDSRDERYVLDRLLELLPPARRAEAVALAASLDSEHRAVLERRRSALQKLTERAQAIHVQVLRRIQTLDNQYAYVRTHILWIRDAEPIGRATLASVPVEFRRLAHAVIRIAWETADRANWGRISVEFALILLTALALPWPLHRARVILNSRLDSHRPAQPRDQV